MSNNFLFLSFLIIFDFFYFLRLNNFTFLRILKIVLLINLCDLIYFLKIFDFFLLSFDFICKVIHALLVHFIASFWQKLSHKSHSMERQFLEDKWPLRQVAAKCILECLDVLHALFKYNRIVCDLLDALDWFKYFIANFFNWNFHSINKRLYLIIICVLRFNLSFMDIVLIILHVLFYQTTKHFIFNIIPLLVHFWTSSKNFEEEKVSVL